MPITPKAVIRWVSKRYVAGSDMQSAISLMRKMSDEGACFTVDVLGEEINSMDEAQFFFEEYSNLIDSIVENDLDANISIKPTAFGLLIDPETALLNIENLVKKAAEHNMFVRLDMEDHRVTGPTIDVCTAIHEKGLHNIGVVLQGRLMRTLSDIADVCATTGKNSDFRICKGIYLEPENIAHTKYWDIVHATNDAIDAMLDSGAYTAIASHDNPVIAYSLAALKSRDMGPDKPDPRHTESPNLCSGKGPGYEFQFLLGVRGDVRRKLSEQGHTTRVYVPYGTKWYEYSMRRLRENPEIAFHVTKALLMPWTNKR
jgi:proline dehydrogenase|tara:strand:+ start:1042 stop:1986 length:945 start_codon:yes stop_codon:yes gene_type:complete